MPIISVRLNSEEEKDFTEYAKFHGKSLSSLLKESLAERMEYELDLKLLAEAREYNKKHTETYTQEQIEKMLDL